MEFDLEAAMLQFPLPEGIEDRVVNRGQVANGLGVSENMITRYLDQGMPVKERGSNGQPYEFQLSECFAWKRWRDDQVRKEREAGDRAAAQLALMFRGEDEADETEPFQTADQIKKESEADYLRNRAAEKRRELVKAAAVVKLFEDAMIEFRTRITTLVDFAEVEFGLDRDQVMKLESRCDAALITARQNLTEVCQKPADVTVMRLDPASRNGG